MVDKFTFHMPTTVCFENGIAKKVKDYITGENVCIISDPFLFENGTAQALGAAMEGLSLIHI